MPFAILGQLWTLVSHSRVLVYELSPPDREFISKKAPRRIWATMRFSEECEPSLPYEGECQITPEP
jgi:hypothetical protein